MKHLLAIAAAGLLFIACNNNNADKTTETTTDTARSAHSDHTDVAGNPSTDMPAGTADAATADFLMKAADGGMAEVAAGQAAQAKASNESVKMFAGMMVNDHTGANAQVKDLAAKLQVTLPAATSEAHQEKINDAGKKEGKAFDKAYMSMMVDDHKKTIALFKEGASNVGNESVKAFINNTLPKLQEHLDSAQAIQKRL